MPFDFAIYEIKPDVFSLEGLIAWLEKQPGETEYNFLDCSGGCLIDTYLAFRFGSKPTDSDYIRFADLCDVEVENYVAVEQPHTYAAALTRARELLKENVQCR